MAPPNFVWWLTILLFQSFVVLDTLQCSLASPSLFHVTNRNTKIPSSTNRDLGEDGPIFLDAELGTDSLFKPLLIYGTDKPVKITNLQRELPASPPYFIRKIRDSSVPASGQQEQIQYYCASRLREALDQVCNGSFHSPPLQKEPSTISGLNPSKKSTSLRIEPGNVVEECCFNPCRKRDLRKYCGNGKGFSSLKKKETPSNMESMEKPKSDEVTQTMEIQKVEPAPETETNLLRSLILTIFKHVFPKSKSKGASTSNQERTLPRTQDRPPSIAAEEDEQGVSPYFRDNSDSGAGSVGSKADSRRYVNRGGNAHTAPLPDRMFPVRLYPSFYQE